MYAVPKANSAYAKTVLDGTLGASGSAAGDAAAEYDLQFTIGRTVYLIDSAAGYFSREMDGVLLYGRLESTWLRPVLIRLGVWSPEEAESGGESAEDYQSKE